MGLLSGPGGGGILGLILNGVQNVQQGLPFLAGPEERRARQQNALEMQKEQFKMQQDTQKAVVNAIVDIFKNPDKQTTETIKWAKDMAPQVGMKIPEGTIAGMYEQAYDKLVNSKLTNQIINQKLTEATQPTQAARVPQSGVVTPMLTNSQSLYQSTHPQTDLVKAALAMNESSGEPDPYQAKERAKGGRGRGKYQFEPGTWSQLAQEVGPIVGRKPSSFNIANPVDQETLATYEIDKHLNAGRTPEQVAVRWQTGDPDSTVTRGVNAQGVAYDVPAYVDRFKQNFAKVQQQYARQQGQGSQGMTYTGTPLPAHNPVANMPVNSLQGMSFTRNAEGQTSVTIDGSKLQPTEEQLFMQYLDGNPPLKQAYLDAKVSSEIYGAEPILFTPITNINGTPGIQMTRKKDGAFLGVNWAITPEGEPIKTKLSPEEEIEQAGKQAAKIAASTPVGKAIGENTPLASLEGKTPAQIEDARKLALSKQEAAGAGQVKRAGEMVPLQTALNQIKEYSKKIHTQNTPVGALLNGMLLTLESKMPTGSNAKTFVDLSGAFVGHLARVYGAERGVLTEQDVKRASKLGVGLFATKEYSQERFKLLEDFSNELAGRAPKTPGTLIKGNVYPNSQGVLYVYQGQNEKGEHGWKPVEKE